jgi:formylglycine-generating enzyme required for sulfatase activity
MTFESLPTTVRNEFASLCDVFEEAWRAGKQPWIEEYVDRRTEPERTVLFRVLLETEVELRREAGDQPDYREYLKRFESFTEVVLTVLADPLSGKEIEAASSATSEPSPDFGPLILMATTLALPSDALDLPSDAAGRNMPERIGRYHVIRPLGHGNFQVYLARDDRDGRDVAIKIARPGVPPVRPRLMSLPEEAEQIRALAHPRIVKLYEYVPPGEPGVGLDGYIVLEYVEGRDGEETLQELFRSGAVPVLRLVRILALVAEALHYAHAHPNHIVHRDLKPSNILLDLRGEPRVCDFGLAVDEEIQRLRRGEIAGTPSYMAPEQVRGETHRLDGRTDIWALGVILYQGLTGRLPFPGEDHDQIFEEILHHDPRPLRGYDPGIEPELERICLRCLSRPMAERYLTASDLADDLKRTIGELTPPPHPIEPIMYKGLRTFDVEDAGFFLALLPGPRRGDGMPESVRFWKDRVEAVEGARTFSVGVLYGPSGGGKSSFVKAGLMPNLDRGRVQAVCIEATPGGTEARLLVELRRVFPSLPPEVNLPDAVALLREDRERRIAGERKLFLVLDQFEQWLQAHSDEPDAELVRALRQCDGRRVGALVLVRDDFWMALTRFLRAVDVPLVQGGNAAAVELFDARHTRKVLEGFGRSLGQLPEAGGAATAKAALFLDEVSRGLADAEGRVIPMQVSLFTEVVRRRPWTPETLRAMGGVDGIGVKFLDDCFAKPEYKNYRGAAQRVLEKLLPPPTSMIRGRPCGGSELRKAAGCMEPPTEFAELVRVLASELRLITAAETDGSTPGPDGAVPSGETHYQLAHDFLVRPIRHWLQRELGSTPKALARLRLTTVTASWLQRPGPRQLPSLLEWAGILRHVPSREWSTDEWRLMLAATRRYVTWGAVVLAALLAAVGLGIKSLRDRDRAGALLGRAVNADYGDLPRMFPDLDTHREALRPALLSLESDTVARERQRGVALILLYRDRPTRERGAALRDRLTAARSQPEEVEAIRAALAAHPDEAGVDELRRMLTDAAAEPAARLRAACALQSISPGRPVDQELRAAAPAIAEALLAEHRGALARWLELLGPAAEVLVAPLSAVCRDHSRDASTRTAAAQVLAEALARGGGDLTLARAVTEAAPDAAKVLLRGLVERGESRGTIGFLRTVLDQVPEVPRGVGRPEELVTRQDPQVSRRAAAAIALAALGDSDALWPLLGHRPDPRLRSLLIQRLADGMLPPRLLVERLSAAALQPIECQALLLAWAEAHHSAVPPALRQSVLAIARDLYDRHPHPGVHAAAGLLLRRWGDAEFLAQANRRPPVRLVGPDGLGWEDGPNGHTFAILPAPRVFRMGSPETEPGRQHDQVPHVRRFERSLAVSMTEATLEQIRGFERDHPQSTRYGGEADRPANNVDWFEAVRYCNWLSGQAGIDPSQWCYPKRTRDGLDVPADAVDKHGFRLPTEAEWEYICRAETETARYFGESELLLTRYAWTWLNSDDRTHPVGQLLPNEFGMFDMLGNVWEWCHDGPDGWFPRNPLRPYPHGTKEQPAGDPGHRERVLFDDGGKPTWRVLRGGAFNFGPWKARSAHRDWMDSIDRAPYIGFRVVRTLRQAPGIDRGGPRSPAALDAPVRPGK